jgi:hypothetical protein
MSTSLPAQTAKIKRLPITQISEVLCEWCGRRFAQVPPHGLFWLHETDDDAFPVCAGCAAGCIEQGKLQGGFE